MKAIKDKIYFSTGKEKHAYGGMVGLSPGMAVGGGFDDAIHDPLWNKDDDDSLTKE